MATKARAAGVTATSFWDLKSELVKQEETFSKAKSLGNNAIVGGVKRADKKPSKWELPNKGVHGRASRDVEWEALSKPTLESTRAALEKKAAIYEKLRKGKSGGLSEKQYEALLVDFDEKANNQPFESDSEDEDESLTVPVDPADDPMVEYEDEFGRVRTVRKSEVPREFMAAKEEIVEQEYDPYLIKNPVNHFPVYEPSAERLAQIKETYSEENNPLASRYDASGDNRAKGAAFYQFSKDEEERQRQMEELRKTREETQKNRTETGAVDILPGQSEDVKDAEEGGLSRSRAMEKRKKDIEDRRKMIEAKRRKLTHHLPEPDFVPSSSSPSSAQPPPAHSAKSHIPAPPAATDADDFLVNLERDLLSKQ
ncbi:hypothetical protein SISSUDRAFT_1059653 [Sistotremastrum suecicum HHB10207 ss-3]|uniref:Uncharacterized protein n=1 Tax=Sistotremastrum suecicum HHB10207 ss-3 TaxID=1314776 RepID=A0A166G502_9AGAM|nr:hypothetical protein SISSUDRAFT_1059653 [Sistotremastrum suecicum HHB10207 ss-3]